MEKRFSDMRGLACCFPGTVIEALSRIADKRKIDIYLVGGTVRDWLLGRPPHDLDLTVAADTEGFCRELISVLGGGALVPLGAGDDEATRVVWRGLDVDISAFRSGARTLKEDICLRDFTVNSMAVSLSSLLDTVREPKLIDPLHGLADLKQGLLRHCPRAFVDDPLRLLRTFRFMATLGFTVETATVEAVRDNVEAIRRVAAERVHYELDLIMQAGNGAEVLWRMHETGLLRPLLPELYAGEGVEQPAFHHLDVFHHNFQTLREMEMLLAAPESVFPEQADDVREYLADSRVAVYLKWAALLHDVGKPAARGVSDDDAGRATFYGHDEIGRKEVESIGKRLKWSNAERERVGHLVSMHMHPFHLVTVRRERPISARAALKLCRRADIDLAGLFFLAMADSLAGCGEQKPENMEQDLVDIYNEIIAIHQEHIRPVLSGPPLLNGRDLMKYFQLEPGPIFSVILDELLVLQVEEVVTTRDEALKWVEYFLKVEKTGQERGKR